ncbi:MAG: COP9 signalosome (CSN) subunit [Phylliscum demangeonii]|nr:MAG: COP9 signalosome (CSN) subunit [Phylliscum demangeonii]
MDDVIHDFRQAQQITSGTLLASTLEPLPTSAGHDPQRLRSFYHRYNKLNVAHELRAQISHRLSRAEGEAWTEVYIAFWRVVGELLSRSDESGTTDAGSPSEEANATAPDWVKIYALWKEVANALIRGYSSAHFPGWTGPCLYVVGKYLTTFAVKADEQLRDKPENEDVFHGGFHEDDDAGTATNEKLEDAARVINRMFTLCISDRTSLEDSRKWAIYYITNLLFKTYFRLHSNGLCKNILRALDASQGDIPPLSSFPKSHVVTFKYYVGVIYFVEEQYAKAEAHLTMAWQMCHRQALKNKELILTYLIPCRLQTSQTLPASTLLAPYAHLQALFGPYCASIRTGNLVGLDAALAAGEAEFIRRRIYLPLERGRDLAVRNLFRRVFLAGAPETVDPDHDASETAAGGSRNVEVDHDAARRTRIPLAELVAAMRMMSGRRRRRTPRRSRRRAAHVDVEGDQAAGDADDDDDEKAEAEEEATRDEDQVQCLLANLFLMNLVKGYVSRERGMLVLSKGGAAFPGTGV